MHLLGLVNQRRLVSDAKANGSLARIQSAVVPLSGKGVFSGPVRLKSWVGLLRGEVHAAQEALEAQRGERGLHQAFHCGPGLSDLRQLGSGMLEVAQEFLVGLESFGFLASLFQDFPQIELRQDIRE